LAELAPQRLRLVEPPWFLRGVFRAPLTNEEALLASWLVINHDGSDTRFQGKVQIDPSEEAIYTPGQAPTLR